MVDQTIGIPYLDGWVPSGGGHENVRVRAVGTRQLHITAANMPVVAALTIIRGGLTKSDVLIKSPFNDPLTANAIARTLIELDASHPVTKPNADLEAELEAVSLEEEFYTVEGDTLKGGW